MTTPTLYFYFDYISPFSYFAWQKARRLDADATSLQPVLFGKLLDHWGQLGPVEIEPKRVWTFKTCFRYALDNDVRFAPPPSHPFNPLPALRLTLAADGADQRRVVDALFDAIWGEGKDGADPPTLAASLTAAGLPGGALLAKTGAAEVKTALAASTQRAIDAGVFGVPSFRVGDELFWGNDQFGDARRAQRGEDPLDGVDIDAQMSRPGVGRRRS